MSDTARASNPGELRVNFLRWFSFYPVWPLVLGAPLLAAIALAIVLHWGFVVLVALLLVVNFLYWTRIREHFRHGCANPAVVVSLDPMLIAVSTDLTHGVGAYPVVKVIEMELKEVGGEEPKVGSKLAAVSLYMPGEDEGLRHWVDFDPRPVECATGDPEQIRRVMQSFEKDDWRELGAHLKKVPRPFKPGLYRIGWGEE